MKRSLEGFLTLALLLTGCANPTPEPPAPVAEAIRLPVPKSVAIEYTARTNMPHSIAADATVSFVAEPLNGRVAVLDRFTGKEIGALPAPAEGFLLPFSVRVKDQGHMVVLDAGGFPDPSVPSIPRVYDYSYRWEPLRRQFTATLTRTVRFDNLPVVFTEDMDVLPDGSYVVSESIIGALWIVSPSGVISPGLFPASFDPADAIPLLAPCEFLGATINGVLYETAGNFGPGVGKVASRGSNLYFSSTCHGGLYSVPIASLTDPTRSPSARAADIVPVSPRADGVVEAFEGLASNRYDARDNAIYASDSFHAQVLRIDVTTGAREVIARDARLFNFPTGLEFAPPVFGFQSLLVTSDQEYRLAALNAALTADILTPPFVLAEIVSLHR